MYIYIHHIYAIYPIYPMAGRIGVTFGRTPRRAGAATIRTWAAAIGRRWSMWCRPMTATRASRTLAFFDGWMVLMIGWLDFSSQVQGLPRRFPWPLAASHQGSRGATRCGTWRRRGYKLWVGLCGATNCTSCNFLGHVFRGKSSDLGSIMTETLTYPQEFDIVYIILFTV